MLHGNPEYSGSAFSYLVLERASLAVGIAKGALDAYEELLRSRKTLVPPIADRYLDADYQHWFGEAIGLVAAAESALCRRGPAVAGRLRQQQRPAGSADRTATGRGLPAGDPVVLAERRALPVPDRGHQRRPAGRSAGTALAGHVDAARPIRFGAGDVHHRQPGPGPQPARAVLTGNRSAQVGRCAESTYGSRRPAAPMDIRPAPLGNCKDAAARTVRT